MPRILISGYYGFGNTGDEAILEATAGELRRQSPEVELSVLTADPEGARALGLDPVSRTSLPAIVGALRRCHLFLSGGGGLLQDSTGAGTVAYYGGLVLLAQLLGRRAMLFCHGVGPLTTGPGRQLARRAVNRATLVTLRDQESLEELRALGVRRPPLRLAADPALLLEPPEPRRMAQVLAEEELLDQVSRMEGPAGRRPGTGPLVVVCPRPWPGAPTEEMARGLAHFAEEERARYLLVPFQPDRDSDACRDLAGRLGPSARLLHRPRPPREIAGLLGCVDMVVGMRLHSLVFAAARGVPFLGLAYDPKVDRFARRAGGTALALEGLTGEALLKALRHILQARSQVRRSLVRRVEPMREAARAAVRAALALARGEPVEGAVRHLSTR